MDTDRNSIKRHKRHLADIVQERRKMHIYANATHLDKMLTRYPDSYFIIHFLLLIIKAPFFEGAKEPTYFFI